MSSKPKPRDVQSSLLAAIQRKVPAAPDALEDDEQTAVVALQEIETVVTAGRSNEHIRAKKARIGSPVQFWFHDEDRRIVRELAAWLAGQGHRPTDSMVIRAALRIAKTDGDLLKAYRQASELDGRLRQHRLK